MINYAGGLPIYLQIAYQIRDDIINRKYEVNAQIPAEEELASTYGVSRMTARNAVTYLVNKGLVYRVHGRGAFVSVQKLNRNLNKLNNFQQDMKALGMRPASNILEFLRRLPTQREQQLLHIHKNQEVFNVKCMRYANGEPLGIQSFIVPTLFIPHLQEADIKKYSFDTYLAEAGYPLDYAEQRIETVLAPEIAKQIGVPPVSPFFYFERLSHTKEQVPVELSHTYFCGDKYSFYITLHSD